LAVDNGGHVIVKNNGIRGKGHGISFEPADKRGVMKPRIIRIVKRSGAPSIGNLADLFESAYKAGKLKLMTAEERRAQIAQAIVDAEELQKQIQQKLKKCTL
jgi:hypothetical protein